MRKQLGYVWVLAAGVAACTLLLSASHSEYIRVSGNGMSAPEPKRASVESSPASGILQSHFDWGGPAVVPASLPLMFLSGRARRDVRQLATPSFQDYSPLHRRPPPSVS